jgi:hypothetical protein
MYTDGLSQHTIADFMVYANLWPERKVIINQLVRISFVACKYCMALPACYVADLRFAGMYSVLVKTAKFD